MERLIEIEGVQYTEAQIKRALAIECDVRSPNFIDMLLGKIELSEFIRSVLLITLNWELRNFSMRREGGKMARVYGVSCYSHLLLKVS